MTTSERPMVNRAKQVAKVPPVSPRRHRSAITKDDRRNIETIKKRRTGDPLRLFLLFHRLDLGPVLVCLSVTTTY